MPEEVGRVYIIQPVHGERIRLQADSALYQDKAQTVIFTRKDRPGSDGLVGRFVVQNLAGWWLESANSA